MSISQPRFWEKDFSPHSNYDRDRRTENLATTFATQPLSQATRLREVFRILHEVEDKLKLVKEVSARPLAGYDLRDASSWADTVMVLFSDIERCGNELYSSNNDLNREAGEMADAVHGVAYFDTFESRMSRADHKLHELLAASSPELVATVEAPDDAIVISRLRELALQEAGETIAVLFDRYYSLPNDARATLPTAVAESVVDLLSGSNGARDQLGRILDGSPGTEFGIAGNRAEIVRTLQEVAQFERSSMDAAQKEALIRARIDEVAFHRGQLEAKSGRLSSVVASWQGVDTPTGQVCAAVYKYQKPEAIAARGIREKIDLVLRVEGIAAQLGVGVDPAVMQSTGVRTADDRDAALDAYQETVGFRLRFGVDPNSLLGATTEKAKTLGPSAARHHAAVNDRLISLDRPVGSLPIVPLSAAVSENAGSIGNA